MKKQVFYNALSIILLNIIFWVYNYYPRHLFDFEATKIAVVSTILNFVYFIGYYFVLYIFFVKNKTVFSKNIRSLFRDFKEQINIKKIVILVVVQIVFEILRISMSALSKEYSSIVIDIFILLSWIIVYSVLTFKRENFIKNKKVLLIAIFSIACVFCVSVIFDNKIISEYQMATQRYEPFSGEKIQIIENLVFKQGVQDLVFDSLLGLAFILFHLVGKQSGDGSLC